MPDEADSSRRQLEIPHRVHEEDREGDVVEEVRQRNGQRERPPEAMAEQVAEPLDELATHAGLCSRLRDNLRSADPEDEAGGADEADGVEQDGVGRGDRSDQHAGEARAGECSTGSAHLELRVPVDELASLDERGQVRLVRDVEEDGADAYDEAHRVELPDRERVEGVREWHRRQGNCATEVAQHEDRPPAQPIHPDPGGQREEQERQELDGAEERYLEGARVQDEDRGERKRQLRDL